MSRENEAVYVISIDNQRRLSLEDEEVSLSDLTLKLDALRESNTDLAVIIRSDRDIPVQAVIDIMDTLKAADITKVGIVTKPEG